MRAVWRVAALVVAALLTLTLLDRFVLVQLFLERAGWAILLACGVALACVGAGWVARRQRDGIALSFVLGYPIFGTVCFLVGLIKVNLLTMTMVVAASAIAGLLALRQAFRAAHPPGSLAPLGMTVGGIVAISLVLLAGFIAAQAPPSSLDELSYHLAIPHAWVIESRAIDLPLISHSYFPLGIESADLPLLTFLGAAGGGIASHFLHLIAAIATTLLIHRRTRDALLTAAIVTTPALALTAGWSLVDWPLLGICVAMLDPEERDVALPAGLLTKYTFLPIGLTFVAAGFSPPGHKNWRAEARRCKAVVFGMVFFIRNLVLTGNPLAPFFGKVSPHVAGYRELTLGSYIFDGRFIDESLGASLLSSLTAITSPIAIVLAILGALMWITAPSARILVPFFATAAAEAKPSWKPLRVVLAIAITTQLFLVAFYVHRTEVFDLLAAKQTDAEFLTKSRAAYAGIAWLNATLPEQSRTLVIGMNETYWFARPVRGGGNFDGTRISEYLDVATPEALKGRLAKDGITHVAVFAQRPQTSVAQKNEERQTRLSSGAQRALAQMLDRYASSVTSRGDVTLFTLR